MRVLVSGVVTALLLLGAFGATPGRVDAACGGGGGDGYLARYAGRHADTILLGRLIESHGDIHRFDVLTVYKGEAASPMEEAGVRDVGSCTGQTVEPGQRFIYVSGHDEQFGPVKLLFPHVSGRRWIIEHFGGTSSLNRLLGLLGVIPDTATSELPTTFVSEPSQTSGGWRELGLAGLAALGAVAYLIHGRPRTRPAD